MLDISKLDPDALTLRATEREVMFVVQKLLDPVTPIFRASTGREKRTLELRWAHQTAGARYLWLIEHHLCCAREEVLGETLGRERRRSPPDVPTLLRDLRYPFDMVPSAMRDRLDPVFEVVRLDVDPGREFERDYTRAENVYKNELQAIQAKTPGTSGAKARITELKHSIAVLESLERELTLWFDLAEVHLTGLTTAKKEAV